MITLPYPPSLNHAYITRRGSNQRIPTPELRAYWEAVKWEVVRQGIRVPFEKLEWVEYKFFFPDNRKRDYENASKCLKDGLKGALYIDDCWQVVSKESYISGGVAPKQPRVEVCWKVA